MTSYIPEYVYGHVPGTYGEMGLIPWPAHMTPREPDQLPDINLKQLYGEPSGVELTKKGEAYVAGALAEAGGVFFLTIDRRDRTAIATTVERLINMLDDMEGDPDLEEPGDLEPNIGWPERGPNAVASSETFKRMGLPGAANDDREQDTADIEAAALERHGRGFYASGPDDCEDTNDHEPSLGGTGSYDTRCLEYDLEQDNADAEPSLGATGEFNQEHSWAHVDLSMSDGEGEDGGDAELEEAELDLGEYDPPGVIWGGGSGDCGRVPA